MRKRILGITLISILMTPACSKPPQPTQKPHVPQIESSTKSNAQDEETHAEAKSKPAVLPLTSLTDAGTTAIALWGGGNFVEKNPLFAWSGDAAPFLVLGAQYGVKQVMLSNGVPEEEANLAIGTVGAVGTCNNIAVLAGATGGVGLALGLVCGVLYAQTERESSETSEKDASLKRTAHPSVRFESSK